MKILENAYRDRGLGLRLRYGELADRFDGLLDRLDDATSRIHRRRVARAAAGLAALVGALVVVALTVFRFFVVADDALAGAPTLALLGTWGLCSVAYMTGFLLAPRLLRRAVAHAVRPTGDIERDFERLENAEPGGAAREIASALERRSVALPLAGLALLAPLSLHWLVYEVVLRDPSESAFQYDSWIGFSLAIVGHCHLTLAVLAFRFASRLRAEAEGRQLLRVMLKPGREGWAALGWVTLLSLVPGVVLLFVPVALVGATGLVFVPLSFWAFGHKAIAERAALAA